MTTETCVDCSTELQEEDVVLCRRQDENGIWGPQPMCQPCWRVYVGAPNDRVPHKVVNPNKEASVIMTVGDLRDALAELDGRIPILINKDGTMYHLTADIFGIDGAGRQLADVLSVGNPADLTDLTKHANLRGD